MPLSAPVTAMAVERSVGRLGRAAAASMQGIRPNFEDAHILDQEIGCFGVYDGHLGDEAAAFCAERLHLHVLAAGEPTSSSSLLAAFASCDEELRVALPEASEAGSTATFAMVCPSGDSKYKIFVANCGDSRAVLWQRNGSLQETRDHRPDDCEERKRIEAAGGFVCDDFDPPRIDAQLACSRALGDFKFKQNKDMKPEEQKVSFAPEVYEWDANEGDMLILACDGVWDTFSSKRVVDEIQKRCGSEDGTFLGDIGEALAGTLQLCIEKDADDNLSLLGIVLGLSPVGAPEESLQGLTVLPGNFLKTKDKEVADQYVEFCLRYGYHLKKEMRPKAPPEASLTKADAAVPGLRYSMLPSLQTHAAKQAEVMVMKVTTKKSIGFYVKAARNLFQGTEEQGAEGKPPKSGVDALRISGLGEAINVAIATAARAESGGLCKICKVQTAQLTLAGARRACPQIYIDVVRKT